MSVIEASREAGFFFFPSSFSFGGGLVGKYCPFIFAKMKKKKSPLAPFFNHPAATRETEVILVWPHIHNLRRWRCQNVAYTPHTAVRPDLPHLVLAGQLSDDLNALS